MNGIHSHLLGSSSGRGRDTAEKRDQDFSRIFNDFTISQRPVHTLLSSGKRAQTLGRGLKHWEGEISPFPLQLPPCSLPSLQKDNIFFSQAAIFLSPKMPKFPPLFPTSNWAPHALFLYGIDTVLNLHAITLNFTSYFWGVNYSFKTTTCWNSPHRLDRSMIKIIITKYNDNIVHKSHLFPKVTRIRNKNS